MSVAGLQPPRPGPVASRRWRVAFAATLAVAMGAGTFPGYAFGVLGPYLIPEFSLSRSQLGLLTTSFFLVGGVLSPVAGPLVDRFGGRRAMVGSFVVLVVGIGGMAVSPSFPLLLAMTAVAGLALAAGNPVTNKLVAVHLPEGRRGVTMGVKQAGVQIGAFLTGALLAPAAAAWGWRAALAASLVIPIAGAGASLRTLPSGGGGQLGGGGGAGGGRVGGAPALRKASLPGAVRWLAVYAFLMGAGVAAVNAYLPLYAVEELGVSVQLAGAVAAIIGFVGILSRVLWGWLTERGGGFVVPLLVMAVGAVVALGLVIAAQLVGTAVLWLAALVFGATAVTWNAVGMLALVTEVDPADAGRASGHVLLGFYGGFVPSPIVFGAIVDATGDYRVAWAGVAAVFVAAALLMSVWRRLPGLGE